MNHTSRATLGLFLVSFAALASACTLDVPIGRLPTRQAVTTDPPADPIHGPVDVLFVVDNSGSMQEEQERLGRTLFDPRCPIQDLTNVPLALHDPDDALLAELLDTCGFVQILAAFDRDFRLGVITTDVNACDNFYPHGQRGDDTGFRPQRGCLQPVPSTGQRFLALEDAAIASRFDEVLDGVGVFGSPFERGFDAVDAFLEGDTFFEECAGDRDRFLRPEAALLIVFLTDEDDCSHADGAFGFDDETLDVCGEDLSIVTEHTTKDCYEHPELLAPVAGYAERWRALKGPGREDAVRVTVLGGAVDQLGTLVPAGCLRDDEGQVTSSCRASGGNSNITGPGLVCDPASPELPCCTADASPRIFELGNRMASSTGDSVCGDSYARAMLRALDIDG